MWSFFVSIAHFLEQLWVRLVPKSKFLQNLAVLLSYMQDALLVAQPKASKH